MVIIESYAYDLPGQSGFVARDPLGSPIAASRQFKTLLCKVRALGHRAYRLKHATANTTRDSSTRARATAGQ